MSMNDEQVKAAVDATLVAHLQGAMEDLAVGMAVEMNYETIFEPAMDDYCPSDDGIAHALREPVSAAAVMMDLCRLLGIEPPQVVSLAMDQTGVLA